MWTALAVWQADYRPNPERLLGHDAERPVVLWLCAGRAHEDDIVSVASARGIRVLPIDILRGGASHDLRRPAVRRELHQLCSAFLADAHTPVVVAAHIASPCRSFSPLNAGLRLRTVQAPDGEQAPADFAAYIADENTIIAACAHVADTLMRRGSPVTWENSPFLGKEGTPWFWAEKRYCASLWHTTALRELAAGHQVIRVTAAMCRFGSRFRKYFTIMAPATMRDALRPLVGRWCPGTGGAHGNHPPACGFDRQGNSQAEAAGRYPRALNEFLVDVLVVASGASARSQLLMSADTARRSTSESADNSDDEAGRESITPASPTIPSWAPAETVAQEGGRITSGPSLDEQVRTAVEAARQAPVGFASYRNLRPATANELWKEPLPQIRELAKGLVPCTPAPHGQPSGSSEERDHIIQWDGRRDWRELVSGAPTHKVTLAELVGADNLACWQAYLERTQAAFDDIRNERRHVPPGDYVLQRSALPTWARPFVWDTGDASDCRPVLRSDRHTVFPGDQQVDREALRRAACVLNWADVDSDIVAQVCEGGMEMRSDAPLHITAMWHHAGVAAHFEVADAVVRDERARLWTTVSCSPMPYVPFTCSPRDVILQERSKLVEGELVNYLKPRLSHNLSAVPRCLGGRKQGVSTNSAVPAWEKQLPGLPTVASYGRAWAVCDLAAGPVDCTGSPATIAATPASERHATRSGVYGVDMEKAYCFVPVQQADRHTGCYLWPDDDGRVRVHVSWRMVFGGSPWPNRFERLSLLSCAWVQRAQSAFDQEQPPTSADARAWAQARAALQEQGVLPAGPEQTRPAGIEPFLDDCSGRALCDTVVVPERLRHRAIGAKQTLAIGARPAPPDSRLAVHCALAIEALEQLGFSIPDEKTMCGSGMALLGALLDTVTRRVRCTEVKRKWILHAVSTFRDSMHARATVDLKLLERFTGRLTNLSQFFPELRHPLSVGYALSRVRWHTATRMARRPADRLHLRPGGAREFQMITLLDIAQSVAEDDEGVFLAPTRLFDAIGTAGVVTVVTDASKADSDDGFGGYAFHQAQPEVVFVMSCPWPADVRTAMSWAALKKCERAEQASPHGALSMPAGETFAALALAEAVVTAVQAETLAVVAVGDCKPAAAALSAIYSRSPQLRHLVGIARRVSTSWLGVAVPRELNVDADRLSHPSKAGGVACEAEAAGARAVWLTPSEAMWAALRDTCRLPMGADPPPWVDE